MPPPSLGRSSTVVPIPLASAMFRLQIGKLTLLGLKIGARQGRA